MPESPSLSNGHEALCEEALQLLSQVLSRDEDTLVKTHLEGFDSRAKVANWLTLFENAILKHVPDFSASTGLDLGCWSGFGSWLLSRLGPRHIFAVDKNESYIRFAKTWAQNLGIQGVTYLTNSSRTIPLLTRSVDWVFINQVFCNMNPEYIDFAIHEVCRVLKPEGKLILCDSNNPYCQETLDRLEDNYRQRELGDGTPENPAGPLFKNRCTFIRNLASRLEEQTVQHLAKNTCYQWGNGLERAVLAYVHNGVEPVSPFRPGIAVPPVNPNHGGAEANITDPFWFLARFEERGINGYITTSPCSEPADNEEVLEMLAESQGFFIFGTKTG